jgi:phage terminase small subunit
LARAQDKRVKQAKDLYEKGLKLIEIANTLNIPEGTVRSWKNRYNWDCNVAKDQCNVAKGKKAEKRGKKEAAEWEVDQVIGNPDLTDKQRLFCIYYIRSFNATKAYQKAYGCSYETAMVEGSSCLRNPKIKSEILKLKQERLNREFLSESDIFQKYMDIAFADITDFLKFGTEEVPIMSLYGPVKTKDPESGEEKMLTKVINKVHFRDSSDVDGTIISEVKQGKDGASIKLSDRMKALEWLSGHMNMGTEEQRARIEQIRAQTELAKAKAQTDEGDEIADDGFLEALKGTAAEDWANGEEESETGI